MTAWTWASPFRLRAAMDPGGESSWSPCRWAAGGCAVLLAAAVLLTVNRGLGLGVLRLRSPWSGHRLRVAGPVSLTMELCKGCWEPSTATWRSRSPGAARWPASCLRRGVAGEDRSVSAGPATAPTTHLIIPVVREADETERRRL